MQPLSASQDTLLLDLYASAAEPARWPGALDRLCAQTGACSAVLQAFSFDGGLARIRWSMQDSRTLQRHRATPGGVADGSNPRLDPGRALRGLNRIARDEELFDPGDQARPLLQQQLATLGLGRFIGTLQDVGQGVYLGLALHRPVDDPRDFSAAQVGALTSLAPHLAQAFALTHRQQDSLQLDQRLRAHLDHLRCGLALCDAQGQVHWLNRSAQRLLGATGPLRLVSGRLCGKSPAEGVALLREMAAAAESAVHTVRYLRFGQGDAGLHVAIQAGAGAATLVLVLTAAGGIDELPADALARMFSLTPTEARLLGALVTGSTVEQYALDRGVTIGTARVQLKQVQAKTGAHRQSDLVRLVLSSAAAHLLPPGLDSSA